MAAGRGAIPALPPGVRRVTERRGEGRPLHEHPEWAASMPWLVQGITDAAQDMSLFAGGRPATILARWQQLRDALGCSVLVHSRQVHEATVLLHGDLPPGIHLAEEADGHATAREGALLAVSVADCVPIYLVAPGARGVAVLHGGWRGVAAGILEAGIGLLTRTFGVAPASLLAHLGPAICAACFEVGAEVVHGLGLAPADPDDRTGARHHVDLRAALAARALEAGVPAGQVTTSAFCTRCGDSPFFSHRGGCRERQLGVVAVRPDVA
jgi:polyphenol oxidase